MDTAIIDTNFVNDIFKERWANGLFDNNVAAYLTAEIAQLITEILLLGERFALYTLSRELRSEHLYFIIMDRVPMDFFGAGLAELSTLLGVFSPDQQKKNPKRAATRGGTVQLNPNSKDYFWQLVNQHISGLSEEKKPRAELLFQISPRMHIILPELTKYIVDDQKNKNITRWITLLKMFEEILTDPPNTPMFKQHLYIFIQDILPWAIMGKTLLLSDPQHTKLRDLASNIIRDLVNYAKSDDILIYVINMYQEGFRRNDIVSAYGAFNGLGNLGENVIRLYLVPQLRMVSSVIYTIWSNDACSTEERDGATLLWLRVIQICSKVVTDMRPQPDIREEYLNDYGTMGEWLFMSSGNFRGEISLVP